MFFTSIQKLLQGAEAVTVVMVPVEDDRVAVTVAAKLAGGKVDPVKSKPISLIGTVAELDAEFGNLISSYAGVRKTLAEQMEQANADAKAAADAAVKAKPATKAATTVSPAKPQSVNIDDLVPDDDDGGDTSNDSCGEDTSHEEAKVPETATGGLDLSSLL